MIVLASGVVCAVALFAPAWRRHGTDGPLDPGRVEHWLVVHAAGHPTLQHLLRWVDRRVVGGVSVGIGFAALWVAALGVGWLLDSVDTGGGFAEYDAAIAAWGTHHATDFSVDALRAVTQLGGTVVVAAAVGLAVAFDYWRHHHAPVVAFGITIVVGVSLLNNTLKAIIDRDRPDIDQLIGSAGSSFPSGHSATAAAGWAAIVLILERSVPRRARPLLVAIGGFIVVAVACSRALLGVHWLTDVLAGVIVGWAWFLVVAVMFGGRVQRLGEPALEATESATSVVPHDERLRR